MKNIDIRTYLRAIVFIVWRVTQATVIFPASAIGLFLAVTTLAGQRPVESALKSIYHYAETNILLVMDCVPQAGTSGLTKPPVLCDSTAPREVGISETIASAVGILQQLYWVLVVSSFGVLLMAIADWRELLGLPAPTFDSASMSTEHLPGR